MVAGDCPDNAEASEWNTSAAVVARAACASMALTGGVAADDVGPDVGADAVAAVYVVPGDGNIA